MIIQNFKRNDRGRRFIRVNGQIRVREVRLIGPDGDQLGIVPTAEALKQARQEGFDLVEVAAQATPPVCRIMDYSRYKYEQSKREKEAKKKQKVIHIKELRCKPNIEEHDYQVKLHHAERFLGKGDKVKVSLMFRGRQRSHPELGTRIIDRFIQDLEPVAVVEKGPLMEGRFINLILTPKS